LLGGWVGAMSNMTSAEKTANGLSLYAGMDEHSSMLYLRPELVANDFRRAHLAWMDSALMSDTSHNATGV
jgi:hypothetical protein